MSNDFIILSTKDGLYFTVLLFLSFFLAPTLVIIAAFLTAPKPRPRIVAEPIVQSVGNSWH